jgi:hypothetical protein
VPRRCTEFVRVLLNGSTGCSPGLVQESSTLGSTQLCNLICFSPSLNTALITPFAQIVNGDRRYPILARRTSVVVGPFGSGNRARTSRAAKFGRRVR